MKLAAALLGTLLLLSRAAVAQGSVSLTVTGGPVAFATPAATDFNTGSIASTGSLTYSVATSGGPPGTSHTSTVSIRATTGTLGGTKPLSDLQWERADLPGTWNGLTTSNTQVEQRTIVRKGANDPWSNSIDFRMLLSYANDAPGSYSTGLVVTLTVTTP
ncbi:MAG TPA: hypothetical protein VFI39_07795 [Gemmatimonadales bacterium]|nr:hypothetical protein [Gemmatimonadales bacterium]